MTVLTSVADGVAVVTLNRPDVRNAINDQVLDDLRAALGEIRDDDKAGAVVFTGAGERAFAAGADIAGLRDYTLHTGLDARMQRLYDEIEAFEKPTIAAVNGYALGGGCELAMACDIRIAAPSAKFGLPETALSVLPGAGGTQRLARLVGVSRAIELILTGRTAGAAEAERIGLVSGIAEHPVAAARDLARTILARGPLAVRLAKLVVRTGMDAGRHTGLVVERLAQALLYTSDDKREGAEAFLAKRPADFTGS
ncbi:enoyl-CoA hydratase/isomerase family protein [Amycolatopsis thermophila]|uniref:Enoyl-CoA hydratase/carnithine racemase n=1 Tax=Amycolatopsis thermophila TaxID=206084 RepID=A0ABU0F4V3_9PSEU|nr:enoyl-CoA hydratase-related protein [Amycolatopsis thermophila]MDQ0382374.1 enoyl-CoA hydratase/carnithine racemase [Amycolatopsis thermophila]